MFDEHLRALGEIAVLVLRPTLSSNCAPATSTAFGKYGHGRVQEILPRPVCSCASRAANPASTYGFAGSACLPGISDASRRPRCAPAAIACLCVAEGELVIAFFFFFRGNGMTLNATCASAALPQVLRRSAERSRLIAGVTAVGKFAARSYKALSAAA